MKKINVRFFVIVIVALVCGASYFAWDSFDRQEEKVSYVDFMQCVEAGDVVSVKFDGDVIHFSTKASPVKFKTQNPNSPLLQEELMKRAIDVTVAKDDAEIISLIFDAFFYLFLSLIVSESLIAKYVVLSPSPKNAVVFFAA